jgi:hypothetical protein
MQVKKPIGRRPKHPPKDAADVIRKAAADGANRVGIGMALGCSYKVLQRWLDEREDLRDALEEGRESERKTLHNRVYEMAVNGEGRDSLLAAFFLLKARHGYVEGEQPQQGNRVTVNFQLPGARPFNPELVIENGTADARTERLPNPAIGRT